MMPTGYTAKLMEEGQTFQEFIMGCARAFGALIDMRDAPHDDPVPEKLEPSSWHAKRLIETKETWARLKSMNDLEKEAFGQSRKDEAIKQEHESFGRCHAEDLRLANMEAQVKAWIHPTPDHKELRDFMLQQINISKHRRESSMGTIQRKPAIAYYVEAISRASSDITYHTEGNAEEIARADGRNEWLQQLRASI